MKKATVLMIIVFIVATVQGAATDEPPSPCMLQPGGKCRIHLPVIPRAYVPNPNLIWNHSGEHGEDAWEFKFPDSGGVVCDCDDHLCPEAQDGDCIFRQGCWHNQTEYIRSNWFWMEARVTYHLTYWWQVWSDEFSLMPEDRSLAYLIDERGRHRVYLSDLNNLPGDTTYWRRYDISISMGESGWYALRIETTTDEEKPHRGLTCFYYDNFQLNVWRPDGCTECAICQLLDQPPVEFCESGTGEDCENCCPEGENCRGLDPGCPVLPPPHQWRLVGRRTICTPGSGHLEELLSFGESEQLSIPIEAERRQKNSLR